MNPWWIFGGLAVAAFLVWLARWAVGAPLDCDRIIADALDPEPLTGTRPEDTVSPDALRLLGDLDAHLDEYVLADPELAAGFDRLRQAIRDHREDES